MIRLCRLAVALVVLSLTVWAPAAHAAPNGVAGHDLLLLHAGSGAHAAIISIPAGHSGAALRLPSGLFDGHGHTLYAAVPDSQASRSTIRAIDPTTGRTLRSLTLAGAYSTQTSDYSGAALSFNGRWLALRALDSTARQTTAIVIDTAAMRVAATIRLSGHFGLDAIDPHGRILYLIENLDRHGPYAYRVRSYEVQKAALDSGPVLEKEESTGTMSGVAWTRAWSPDGDWLFTLYVRPGRQGAFIHALGVNYRLAQCIDLPMNGAEAADLAHFTLSVSPEGFALYAINPVLGKGFAMRGSLPFGSTEVQPLSLHAGSAARTLNGAAISPDGQRIFVATASGIWVIDAGLLQLNTTYLKGVRVDSVALSRDGRRLYALEPAHNAIATLDAATGRILGAVASVEGGWAIGGVVSSQ